MKKKKMKLRLQDLEDERKILYGLLDMKVINLERDTKTSISANSELELLNQKNSIWMKWKKKTS